MDALPGALFYNFGAFWELKWSRQLSQMGSETEPTAEKRARRKNTDFETENNGRGFPKCFFSRMPPKAWNHENIDFTLYFTVYSARAAFARRAKMEASVLAEGLRKRTREARKKIAEVMKKRQKHIKNRQNI